MPFIIYKTTNLINQKIYIGKHATVNIYDGYLGSGSLLKKAILKYGKENFKKEVLFVLDTEKEMDEKEAEIVNEEFCQRDDNYNLACGGKGGFGYINANRDKFDNPFNDPIRKAEIDAKSKSVLTEKYGQNYHGIIGKNSNQTPEQRAVISKRQSENNSFAGKKHSDESRMKMKNSHSNRQIRFKDSDGNVHNSIREGVIALNVPQSTIRYRIANSTYQKI